VSQRPRRMPARGQIAVVAATALGLASITASAAYAEDGPEQIVNGTFDAGTAPWWWTGNAPAAVANGQLCAPIPGGTTNPWDAIIGQNDIRLQAGESYTFSFNASASAPVVIRANVQLADPPFTQAFSAAPALAGDLQTYSYTFTSTLDTDAGQVAFQVGGSAAAYTFCIDDVSLRGGATPPVYVPDTGPRVRVNQVGYLPKGPTRATLVTTAESALAWQLVDSAGTTVANGQTVPRGVDGSSGQNVHSVDFTGVTATGAGFRLVADGETSHPFDIATGAYERLRVDALSFYYTQRSGIEILDSIAPGYARPAGHLGVAPNQGDTAVPCQPGVCDYTLDVRGGWYDAGDHGKYVVNGGISVAQLMSEFERTKVAPNADKLGDSTLRLPERGNGVPDILDEARWELEFLLRMQVPAGKPFAGMAHHKVHDENWTGLPLDPSKDPQKRELHPVSTAATLNLAAAAAQGARLFFHYDRAFSDRLLAAARTAWAAALANPARYALPSDATGGGPYDDDYVVDEFYWAAAELYISTGEKAFADHIMASPEHTKDIFRPEGFDWKYTAALGRLQLAAIPNGLPDRARVRQSVVDGAGRYLATLRAHPYGLAYAPPSGMFDWGSNNLVLNNLVVMASGYDISGDAALREGVIEGMDYLLGRNALNQSYITGYGENAAENQHSRWYSHQLNPALPNPPAGSLSGGPNSSIQDPVAQRLLQGCKPQFCYVDDIESWSTNELTINWNSTLSWVSAFVADQGDGSGVARTPVDVRHVELAQWSGNFITLVVVTNRGSSTLNGWSVRWAYTGTQRVTYAFNASISQDGATVTASDPGRLRPGQSTAFIVFGKLAW
jgi:endoglucanase